MSPDPAILAGLLMYLVVMIAVGLAAYRYMNTLDDFVLGGRRLGPWVAAISERASGESAWFLLGLPAAAYGVGFREYWSVIGIAGGILVSWTFIAIPLRRETARLGALTLPDYFELRFDDRSRVLRVISMVVILVFYTAYIAAQLVGSVMILGPVIGLSPGWALFVGATVVLAYTLLGGFLAVAWTDFIQGILMTLVAVLLPVLGLIKIGGPAALVEKLEHKGPEFLDVTGGEVGHAFWFGIVIGGLAWGFGYLGQPHLLMRYMAIRKTSELPRSGLIAMSWTLVSYWGAPMIGIVAAVLLPAVEQADQVMPLLAAELLPGWLAGIMIAGATAAMMSSADSQLLVASSTLVEDIYVRLFGVKTSPRRLVLASRIATIVIAGIAVGLAYNALSQRQAGAGAGQKSLIDYMVAYAWTGLGASFGPALVLALWWRGTTRWGVLAGMLTGMTATVVWQNSSAWLGTNLNGLLDIKAAAVTISALMVVLVSLSTRSPAVPSD